MTVGISKYREGLRGKENEVIHEFTIEKVANSYFRVDSIDSVFTFILDSFHQNDSHKNGLKTGTVSGGQKLKISQNK